MYIYKQTNISFNFPCFQRKCFSCHKEVFSLFFENLLAFPRWMDSKGLLYIKFYYSITTKKKMNNSSLMRGGEEYYSETFPIYNFQWVTEGLLLLIVSTIGIVGNACSVVTCTKQRIQRVFHRLLLALATFDTVSSYIISLYLFYNWSCAHIRTT